MWEHGGSLEIVQEDSIWRCGHLDQHDIGKCEMWARAEGIETILTDATGTYAARFCYFCGGAECMCQCGCN